MADQPDTEPTRQELHEQLIAVQAELASSRAANAQGNQGGLNPNPAASAATFALSPALASQGVFLDLSTSSGTKLFKHGCEALPQAFDFSDSTQLHVFLDYVLAKSRVHGWSRLFTVPVQVDGAMTQQNMLESYGVVTLAAVTADALTYVDTHTKTAQDSFMLYQCIHASLTKEFLNSITTESTSYHLGRDRLPVGAAFFQVIIMKTHVDSRAAVSYLRSALSTLDAKMVELDSDVTLFNQCVKRLLQDLSARGETSHDNLENVFKGYGVVTDSQFRDFATRKLDAWEDGGNLTVEALLEAGETKHKTLLLRKQWKALSKEEEQIIALSAQIDRLQKAPPSKSRPPAGAKTANAKAKQKARDDKWAWKRIPPKEGEPVTKVVGGKHYHLTCEHHPNQWVCHTSEQCSKNPKNNGVPKYTDENSKLQAARLAATALAAEEGQEDDSDEDLDQ
jgi:hypothetical protein